jgi:hypothetical protein
MKTLAPMGALFRFPSRSIGMPTALLAAVGDPTAFHHPFPNI